jgi:hypothetical protein
MYRKNENDGENEREKEQKRERKKERKEEIHKRGESEIRNEKKIIIKTILR